MGRTVTDLAERRRSLFRMIASAPGGAARRMLDPAALRRAQARVAALAPEVHAEMREAIAAIVAEADAGHSAETILNRAHAVHGLAGCFGLEGPGVVAGEIREYILGLEGSLKPDWALLRLMAALLSRSFERPGDAPSQTIADQARALVAWALARREPVA